MLAGQHAEGFRGLRELVGGLDGDAQGSGAEQRAEALDRLERAFTEAIAYYKTPSNKERVLAILSKYLQVDNLSALANAYEIYAPAWPRVPAVDRDAFDSTVAVLNEFGGRTVSVSYETYVDPRPLQRVQQSGFVDGLYR